MLFSVCIPVYNTSEYLDECIASVLSQTEKDFEIILIDDGSTDGSGAVCDAYAEKYPNIRVVHKENEGLMMTRRRGFKEAQGDYFVCLDSDDYFVTDRALLRIRDLIEKENCDLVVYDYIMGKENGNRHISLFDREDGYVFAESDKAELYKEFLTGKWLNPLWIKAVSRSLVDTCADYSQWKEDICRGEDMFQTYPILTNAKRAGYIKEPFVCYRSTAGSISNNPKLQFYRAYRAIYRREDEYMSLWKVDRETEKRAKLRRIPQILNVLITGYHGAKKTGKLEEWKAFMGDISRDEFFAELYPREYMKDILPYYRFLRRLILANNTSVLAVTLDAYRWYLEKIKRKR